MDHEEFFDKFVSKYPVYQNNKTVKVLFNTFKKHFLKDLYTDIPNIFKKLYEVGEIPEEVYDQFLVDIGVSKNLIDQLTNNEKLIFIKSLADFQKFKGTIGLVQNVIKAYGDNIDIYELYVDYNKKRGEWECKPYLIYKPEHSEGYQKTIPYRVVYNKIPSLLVHEKKLDEIRDKKLGVFPIKTNILFISSNYNTSVTGYIQNLITSIFYNQFYDEELNLYFEEKLFTCKLYQFVLLWLYLIFKKNGGFVDDKLDGLYITFNRSLIEQQGLTLEDVDHILEEYDNIFVDSSARSCGQNEVLISKFDTFYNKYILPFKIQLTSSDSILNLQVIEQQLKNENIELLEFINKKIKSETDIIDLLGILVKSLYTHSKLTDQEYFLKYFQYFKSFLPTIDLTPTKNTVYKILYYVKPFHAEILDLTDYSLILSNDLFNSITFDNFYRTYLYSHYADVQYCEILNKAVMIRRWLDNFPVVSVGEPFGSISNEDENLDPTDNTRHFYTLPDVEEDMKPSDDIVFLYRLYVPSFDPVISEDNIEPSDEFTIISVFIPKDESGLTLLDESGEIIYDREIL